ncbi:MAG: hypothetical protein SAL07_23815, partial [Oscillatoria sp. PMC 1051.18]|nr:hypothetical protein [Oscillatoria sp. PMC 1050.18]MEC5032940.1 hypothetical protein [Oscillatoria sp. PMC 1051.18]
TDQLQKLDAVDAVNVDDKAQSPSVSEFESNSESESTDCQVAASSSKVAAPLPEVSGEQVNNDVSSVSSEVVNNSESEVEVDSKIQSSVKSSSESEVDVELTERSEAINDLAWFLTSYAENNLAEDLLKHLFEGYPEGDKLNAQCEWDLFWAALERLDGKEREWVELVIAEYKKPMFSVGDRVKVRYDFDSVRNSYVGVITSIDKGCAEIRLEHPVKNTYGGVHYTASCPVLNLTHFEGEAPIPVEPKPFKKPEVSTKSESDEKPAPSPKATQLDLGIVVQQPEPPLGDYWE